MSSLMNSRNIISALINIRSKLPSLLGTDNWVKISEIFNSKLDQLQHSTDDIEQQQLAANLIGMLASYDDAREYLKEVIAAESEQTDPYGSFLSNLASIAEQMGLEGVRARLDAEALQSSSEQARVVFMKGNLSRAKSIKLKNLSFDFGEMSELATGVLSVGSRIFGDTHPILMAAGVLLVVRSIYKAMTVEIEEREASVFWGFIQACDKEKAASEADIKECTNEERLKTGLKPLDSDQIKNALYKLLSIKSVTPIEDEPETWRITEKYRIQE
jgi:hypothetical protein